MREDQDATMRDLPCTHLQMDEIWGYIGKKQRHVAPSDDPSMGDAWTFCAIDSETKLVPAFKVGKRDSETANAFVADLASRLRNRVQLSTDGLAAYPEAVELAFGAEIDYAQIIKTYTEDQSKTPERRYSAARHSDLQSLVARSRGRGGLSLFLAYFLREGLMAKRD